MVLTWATARLGSMSATTRRMLRIRMVGSASAHGQVHQALGAVVVARRGQPHRDVQLGAGRLVDAALLDVVDHADDGLERPLVVAAERDLATDRVQPGEELSRHGLVDDDDRLRALAVALVEGAAAQQLDPHGREVVVAGELPVVDVPGRPLVLVRRLHADEVDVVGVHLARRRHAGHQGRGPHAGQPAHLALQALPGADDSGRLRVVPERQLDPHRQQILGVEAEVDLLDAAEAAQHEPAADHQHHRERDLDHHQPPPQPQPAAAGRGARAPFLKSVVHIVDPGVQGGRQPEQQADQERADHADHQHHHVDADLRLARRALRQECHRQVDAPDRERQAQPGADEAQHRRLGQELADDAEAVGADGGADRDLPDPRLGAGQQQAGDVRRRDEQEEGDRALEQEQRPPRAPHGLAVERVRDDRVVGQGIGVVALVALLRPGHEGVEIGARLGQRDPRLEPGHHAHEMVAAPPLREVEAERHPDLGVRGGEREALRHHADHGHRRGIDRDPLADDLPVAAERALPQAVAEHDRARVARAILLAREQAAHGRLHADGLQQRPDDVGGRHAHRHGSAGDRRPALGPGADRLERLGLLAQLDVLGRRDREALVAHPAAEELAVQADQPVRLRVGQRLQDHRVDDRKNHRVGADRDAERHDRDQRQGRILEHHPQREADVLQQGVHWIPPSHASDGPLPWPRICWSGGCDRCVCGTTDPGAGQGVPGPFAPGSAPVIRRARAPRWCRRRAAGPGAPRSRPGRAGSRARATRGGRRRSGATGPGRCPTPPAWW